jgi:hypothetical protein
MKWIESCFEYVSIKNDATQWLSSYLGKNLKVPSLLPYRPLKFQWLNAWMREVLVQCGLM